MAEPRRVELLHFNDVYHCDDFQGKTQRALRMFLSMRPHLEALSPLVTFSGDLLAPSLMSSVTKGKHMMEVLELLGVHVATMGNHDFDFGIDQFRFLTQEPSLFDHEGPPQQAKTEWISSNLTGLDGQPVGGARRWWLQERQGVQVGIIAVSENWLADAGLSAASPTADKHAQWADEVLVARECAAHVRSQGAELVLCLCHDTLDCTKQLADSVPEVDFFLGGHEHIYDEGDRWVIAGFDFDDFCLLTFEIPADGARPSCIARRRVQVPADEPTAEALEEMVLAGDAARLRRLVEHYCQFVAESLAKPLGCSLGRALDTRKFLLRTQETPAGNLFADAVLEALRPHGAECCLLISGMVSAGPGRTPAGPLTLGNVVQWFPWEGGTCIIEVSGATLLQALEHGCHKLPYRYGLFPQVSGLEFCITMDPEAAAGAAGSPFHRVSCVRVAGEPLDEARAYHIATGEYLADGGDDYSMLVPARRLLSPEAAPLLHEVVVSRLLSLGPEVEPPAVGGRIRHTRTFTMVVPSCEVGATPMDPETLEETIVHADPQSPALAVQAP